MIEEEIEFITKIKFSKMVEELSTQKNMSYIDAVLHICEQNAIEIEDSKKYISISLKQKIEVEAMNLNFLEKNDSLPID